MTATLILSPSPAPPLFAPTQQAKRRVAEFFTAQINKDHTRKAYLNAACFSNWCEGHGLHQLADVQPIDVAAFVKELQGEISEAFEGLARMPGMGHRRSDLTSHGVFFFAVYQYMIVYRKNTPLEIVAVIHGNRDVERILERAPYEQRNPRYRRPPKYDLPLSPAA